MSRLVGGAAERRAAQHYLGRNRHEGPVRFDVVAIDGRDVELIVDAFRPAA
jgi:Holliday junction resolvase-like predicted endonuclease